jgi:integrase
LQQLMFRPPIDTLLGDDVGACALLEALPPLGRTMVGLAMLSGVRRGELFALRWRDLDEQDRTLATVREHQQSGRRVVQRVHKALRTVRGVLEEVVRDPVEIRGCLLGPPEFHQGRD